MGREVLGALLELLWSTGRVLQISGLDNLAYERLYIPQQLHVCVWARISVCKCKLVHGYAPGMRNGGDSSKRS